MQNCLFLPAAAAQKKAMLAFASSAFSGEALFAVVLLLAILIVLILIYSRITGGNGSAEACAPVPAQPGPAAKIPAAARTGAPEDSLTQDAAEAMALSAVCDDLGVKPEELVVRSFREIKS